jgi:sulfur carrier protein
MQLTINDTPRDIPDDLDNLTVEALLQHLDVAARLTAVLHNGEIVRREHYGARRLRPGDRLEIVTLVGGG